MSRNPFGEGPGSSRRNPFGEEPDTSSTVDSINRIEHASRTVRRLKTQLGAEGLTLSATREMIDEISHALDATARVLKELTADRKE